MSGTRCRGKQREAGPERGGGSARTEGRAGLGTRTRYDTDLGERASYCTLGGGWPVNGGLDRPGEVHGNPLRGAWEATGTRECMDEREVPP